MGLLAFIVLNALLVMALLGAISKPSSVSGFLRELTRHPFVFAFQLTFLGSCFVAGWGILSGGYLSWPIRTDWGTIQTWQLAGLVAIGCVLLMFGYSVYENDFKSRRE